MPLAGQEKAEWRARVSLADLVRAVGMAVACLAAWWLMTFGLVRLVDRPSDLLGGMWAAIAASFVFRDTRAGSVQAGMARLFATSVSFALCLPYLLLFPFTPAGMAALMAIGALVMALLDRRDDIITTTITTIVVMVVAAISPAEASLQPLLRLADTIVGVAVGVGCDWSGSFLLERFTRRG